MHEYLFSLHAQGQMLKRGIAANQVLETIRSGHMIAATDNVSIYQRLHNFDGKDFLIRVFLNTEKTPQLIITVYKTSKIEKYL